MKCTKNIQNIKNNTQIQKRKQTDRLPKLKQRKTETVAESVIRKENDSLR